MCRTLAKKDGPKCLAVSRFPSSCCCANTICGNGLPLLLSFVSVSSVQMTPARPSTGLIATLNRSSKFRVPGTQPVPLVQITPVWFDALLATLCVKVAPLLLVCARYTFHTAVGSSLLVAVVP